MCVPAVLPTEIVFKTTNIREDIGLKTYENEYEEISIINDFFMHDCIY